MYKSEELKRIYYEYKIIKNYIDTEGNIPSKNLVDKKIQSLDLSKSIIQPYEVVAGDLLNPERYVELIGALKEDLNILYKVIKDYSLNDYYYLKLYIRNNLISLQKQVEKHKNMAKQLDYIGKTLLFLNEFEYKDNIINISERLSIKDKANLLFSINGLDYTTKPYLVIEKNGKIIINKLIESKNTYIKIPGSDIVPRKYMYQLSDYKINQIDNLNINKTYSIFDGRNKVLLNDKPSDLPLTPIKVSEDTIVKFYPIDKAVIGINTSTPKKIDRKNFAWFDNIDSDFVFMRALKDCTFSIGNVGGSIYAKNYKLGNTNTFSIENAIDKSLLIYEYDKPKSNDYNIYIKTDQNKQAIITNMFIKEQ